MEQEHRRHGVRVLQPKGRHARFARLYEAGLLQLDEMVTRRYRLDDINEGYRDLLNGEIIRGVIDFALDQ